MHIDGSNSGNGASNVYPAGNNDNSARAENTQPSRSELLAEALKDGKVSSSELEELKEVLNKDELRSLSRGEVPKTVIEDLKNSDIDEKQIEKVLDKVRKNTQRKNARIARQEIRSMKQSYRMAMREARKMGNDSDCAGVYDNNPPSPHYIKRNKFGY